MRRLLKDPEPMDVKTISGTSYTITRADVGSLLIFTSSSAITITLPADSVEPVPIGSWINFMKTSSSTITVSAGSGATVNTSSVATYKNQYAVGAFIKWDANKWVLSGERS